MKKILLAITLLIASAANAGDLGIAVSLKSWHYAGDMKTCNDGRPLNENNPGIFAKYYASESVTYEIGVFKNSIRNTSVSVGGSWQPLSFGPIKAGMFGGIASGYCNGFMPIGGLVLTYSASKHFDIEFVATPSVTKTGEGFTALRGVYRF